MSSAGFILNHLPATPDLKRFTAVDGHFTLTLVLTEVTLLFLDWKCCLLVRKGFLPSSYKGQVVHRKGRVHSDVQAPASPAPQGSR